MTVILGNTINSSDTERLKSIVTTIPRFTYHRDFDPLSNGLKSDKNWGCCIRCGQSLLSQYIMKVYGIIGRPKFSQIFPQMKYDFLDLFHDDRNMPFSIHSFCREISILGGKPGEWVKTSILAKTLQQLLLPFGLKTVVAENGCLSREELRNALNGNDVPVLLLFPLMLGLKTFDMKFLAFLEVSLSVVPQSIGVVGGQQGKAYYLVGYQKSDLLYFDPHETMDAVKKTDDHSILFKAQLKRMNATQLNSSLLIGFLITKADDAEELPIVLSASGECPIQIIDSIKEFNVGLDECEGWDLVQ